MTFIQSTQHRRNSPIPLRIAVIRLLAAGALALLIAACGSGGGGTGPATVDLTVSVQIPTASSNGIQALSVPADIQAVWMKVTNLSGPTVVQDLELARNATTGAYEGILSSMPVGPTLEFLAEGYDALTVGGVRTGTVIYSGTTTQAITGAPDEVVTVHLNAIGGAIGQPLGVTLTGNENAVLPSAASMVITFTVTGAAADTVNWSITAGAAGGSFSPTGDGGGGLLLDGTGTGQFTSTYTAPAVEDTYFHSVTVTSPAAGQTVVQEFYTEVSAAATGGGAEVFISPSVTGFSLQRTWENNLFITASVVDDKPVADLSYTWGYSADASTPALAYTDFAFNPAELENYGPDDISGTVTLQVADADGGSTLVNFTLPPGLFPDAVGLPNSRKAVLLSAFASHTCALLRGGEVACWGANPQGQLGDTSSTNRTQPVGVREIGGRLTTATRSVSAGLNHTCAATTSGASCWGLNSSGELGNGTLTSSSFAMPVSGIVSVEEVGAGSSFSCARLTDGKVQCWGSNDEGRLGVGQFNPLPPDGNNATTGRSMPVNVVDVDGSVAGKIATDLAVGFDYACALLDDTTVKCWGNNLNGMLGDNNVPNDAATPVAVQTENPTAPGTFIALDNVTAITAGWLHACALRVGGTVWCWGQQGSGRLGTGATSAIMPRAVQAAVIDGSTPALTATTVDAGNQHTCALMGDGTVRCWGGNTIGQLGDGTITTRITPTALAINIQPTHPAIAIAASSRFSCAILSGGNLRCWGDNGQGMLGSGDLLSVKQLRPVGVDLFPGTLP